MSSPKAGSPEWQEALNRQVEQHDRDARESGNENERFEIGRGY